MGGLPWDDYKKKRGSGLAAGGGVDYIGTTGGEATLSMGYTMLLHYGLLWAVWATLQVYEDSNIEGGGTGATEVTGATSGGDDESGTAGTTH